MLSEAGQQPEAEYDAWEHISADAFDAPRRGIIALLTAYFDAANDPTVKGRPDRPLMHSVGYWLGYTDDWRKFRREWNKELKKAGVGYFHMTDFEWALNQVINEKDLPRDNFYYGWTRDNFLAFQKRLYQILNRKRKDGMYRLAGFASNVNKAEFDANLPNELKDDPECRSYYIFNVANAMKTIAAWCNDNFEHYKYNPIHYIFASGDGEGGNLERWFKFCRDDEGDRFYFRLGKGYSLAYDMAWMEHEPALQAADVAAFELSKVGVEVAARGHTDIPLGELRRSLPVLFQAGGLSMTLTGSQLVSAFDQIISRRKAQKIAKETNADLMLPPE